AAVGRRGPARQRHRPARRLQRAHHRPHRSRPRTRRLTTRPLTLMSSARYSDLQLDALRELANIGSDNASTALSALLSRPVDISVPNATALDLADAVDAAGAGEDVVWAVLVAVGGELEATALLVVSEDDAEAMGALLGVDPESEEGRSAL